MNSPVNPTCRLLPTLVFAIIGSLLLSNTVVLATNPIETQAKRWDVVELSFTTTCVPEYPFNVQFGAVFTHPDGESMQVPGFYNGDQNFLIRFCPPTTGSWTFDTYASIPDLAGRKGVVSVTDHPSSGQHGPIRVSGTDPQAFEYADGTPYFLIAFELDWLFALDAENPDDIPLTRGIVKDIADNGFNQIVMNVFAYDAGWGERNKALPQHRFDRPNVFPFKGNNLEPDYSALDVTFFQRLDRVIEHLNDLQIVAHLMIYVWNKQVNWPPAESMADNLYFDYVVKRYQAYPNLIWDISKEALAYGRDDMGYITRRIDRLRKLDANRRLLTVHDYNYCDAHPEKVDFISIQEWEPYLYYRMVEVCKRHHSQPVFNIEHGGYEKTTYSIFDGAYTDPVTCLDRTYQCVFAGVYSTYYWQNTSWYNVITEPFKLPPAEQPHFHYYKHLVSLFGKYPYNTLSPRQNAFSLPYLTNGDDLYLFYVSGDRKGIFGALEELKGKQARVSWFDPLNGETIHQPDWDFTNGTWLGINKPEDLTGELAVAILEIIK